MNINKKVLVTGAAGFIGFHLVGKFIKENYEVVGLDIINEYYDVNLKYARLSEHGILKDSIQLNQLRSSIKFENYKFLKADLSDNEFIIKFMISQKFDYVVNLAAQAGVRFSINQPFAYIDSNVTGFLSILEGCRYSDVKHLLYASTSSVYGLNTKMPLHEAMPTEHPMALYAATKKANELMAHSYSHLFSIPTTGLRFFTVYGPWGRPDMALFLFTKSILAKEPIRIFNHGKMIRDFTYVADIVESIYRLTSIPAKPNPNWNSEDPEICSSSAPYQILNIGNSYPVKLMDYIIALEGSLNLDAQKEFLPMQQGDVTATHADTSRLKEIINFSPETSIQTGINKFVDWYRKYYIV